MMWPAFLLASFLISGLSKLELTISQPQLCLNAIAFEAFQRNPSAGSINEALLFLQEKYSSQTRGVFWVFLIELSVHGVCSFGMWNR